MQQSRGRHGNYLSNHELETILRLLRSTELTLPIIAARFEVSRATIHAVNLKFKIRNYSGKRATWTMAEIAESSP